MFKNKRIHERHPLFAITQVQIIDSEEPPLSCLMQCISKSGMGIYAYVMIEKDTAVSVEVKFTNVDRERVSDIVEGRVASVAERDNTYCIGIAFNKELSPDEQPYLYAHLDEFAKLK